MAPYQFFLLFVALLFIGVAAVTLNQASHDREDTPTHEIVEVEPAAPITPALPDTVRL